MSKRRLKVGDRVKWEDPGILDYELEDRAWALDRIFIIEKFEESRKDPDRLTFLVSEDGFSETQAWEHELKRV